MIKEKITIYYDKECPFCNSYVGYLKLKDSYELILKNVREDKNEILDAIRKADTMVNENGYTFGDGRSSERFYEIIKSNETWEVPKQKYFVDIDF